MVIKLIKGDKPPLSLIDALLFALMFGKGSLKSHEGGSPVRRNKIPLLMDMSQGCQLQWFLNFLRRFPVELIF